MADHDSAYCATQPDAPRSANRPTITSGTIHNGTPPAWKPWSSSGFISQGSTGSVAEPTSEPAIATANPARALGEVRRDAGDALLEGLHEGVDGTGRVGGDRLSAARLPTIGLLMPSPQDTVNLSVILITCNESRNVLACLQSVAFADEWIVVDSGSSDDTREIAVAFGARVVQTDRLARLRRAEESCPGAGPRSLGAEHRCRRACQRRTRGADSCASSSGAAAAPAGYELSRLSSFCGQWMRHGDWYPDRVLRLFRREAGRFSDDLVHERLRVHGEVRAPARATCCTTRCRAWTTRWRR